MTTREVVENIARAKTIEQIIAKVTNNSKDDQLNDLANDIYLQLLEDDRIVGMYQRNQHKYFISRIVMNNICSNTSPYYWTYKRPQNLCTDIGDIDIEDE